MMIYTKTALWLHLMGRVEITAKPGATQAIGVSVPSSQGSSDAFIGISTFNDRSCILANATLSGNACNLDLEQDGPRPFENSFYRVHVDATSQFMAAIMIMTWMMPLKILYGMALDMPAS